MNMKTIIHSIVLVALLGCGKHPEPRQIVILVDVSGSIERRSLEQAFRAIGETGRPVAQRRWAHDHPNFGGC